MFRKTAGGVSQTFIGRSTIASQYQKSITELLVIHFQLSRIFNDFVHILDGLEAFYFVYKNISFCISSSHIFYHFI